MIRYQARPASAERYVLAEGPVWDPVRQRVLWVDINGHHVLTGKLTAGEPTADEPTADEPTAGEPTADEQTAAEQTAAERVADEPTAGWIVETERLTFADTVGAVVCSEAGQLLVAGPQGLFTVPAGSELQLIPPDQGSRLNDGGCDPAGRFLVGSLALDRRTDDEQLLRVEGGGQVTVIDEHLGLSNGLAWSPDGAWFYSIDTIPGLIWIRSYHGDSGRYGERRIFLKISSGYPDGMCVDAEGNLWVAIWGAGEVRCFSPTAELLATVAVAAPNTSSVAFIGPDLNTLLITTASEQLSAARLAQFPDSGKLFTASVGKTGFPTPYWSGA